MWGVNMIKISDKEFDMLSKYIKVHSGIHLKTEKKTLLVGRLSNMLSEMGITSFEAYYDFLQGDASGKELSRLIDKVTTNHTFFMRESEHFNYFSQEVLPFWEMHAKTKDLRVWCAASSTGEEPYTLAMLLEDYFKGKPDKWDKKLLATDLSVNVLTKAKDGIYSADQVDKLSRLWMLNYFDKVSSDRFQVKQNIRNEVIYRRFNLMENQFPFKNKFHVVFCRNVMIYFDTETKKKLVQKIYDHMETGGYLFIGHSESLNRNETDFTYIKPAVYRKM